MGVQQETALSNKSIYAGASVRNQSNQLSVISQEDEENQAGADMAEVGVQPTL